MSDITIERGRNGDLAEILRNFGSARYAQTRRASAGSSLGSA